MTSYHGVNRFVSNGVMQPVNTGQTVSCRSGRAARRLLSRNSRRSSAAVQARCGRGERRRRAHAPPQGNTGTLYLVRRCRHSLDRRAGRCDEQLCRPHRSVPRSRYVVRNGGFHILDNLAPKKSTKVSRTTRLGASRCGGATAASGCGSYSPSGNSDSRGNVTDIVVPRPSALEA